MYIDRLRKLSDPETEEAFVKCRDINTYSNDEWALAQERFSCIRPLIDNPYRTRKDAEDVASKAGVHVATVYSWMKAWDQNGHISALIPQKPGRKEGTTLLTRQQEIIIESVIDEVYLSEQRLTPTEVIEEVKIQCKIAKIKAPHANTIRSRIRQLDSQYVLKRRGRRDKARDMYDAIKGKFPGADAPLAVIQIDHTQADVIVVDDVTREPLGRPWLTLAMDIYSRAVVGVYVSMEHPSAVAAGACLSLAMLPKRDYLEKLDVPGEWPMYGKMQTVHADNAKEFRGKMLQNSCKAYSIDLELRPVKKPHYGGHIERYMGVASKQLKKLPGTTFSNPAERKGYNSEKKATMTLREVEAYLVDFIVNVYHQRIHSGISCTPLKKWEIGILGNDDDLGTGLPHVPADPDRLVLDFLPFEYRTVQTYGIQLDKVQYYTEVLNKWINAMDPEDDRRKRQFIVRRHPRDISKIYFYDPDAEAYYVIPYRDPTHPAISVWELRRAQAKLKEEAVLDVDEEKIFDAVLRMRQKVVDATKETKSIRRARAQLKETEKAAKQTSPAAIVGIVASLPDKKSESVQVEDEDYFDSIDFDSITPFSDLEGGLSNV